MKKVLAYCMSIGVILFLYYSALAHPAPEIPKPYFEKVFYTQPLPLTEAILDRATGFLFIKLRQRRTENGRCAMPAEFIFEYVAYPINKLTPFLESPWHMLVVSYKVSITSAQYIPAGECSREWDSKQLIEGIITPTGNIALLAKDLVILFPSKENRVQWVTIIEKVMAELAEKQVSKNKSVGELEIPLEAR